MDHLNGILYTDHMEAHEKLVKVEAEDESNGDTEGDTEEDTDHAADEPTASHDSDTGLWLPEQDSRNTPATLKLK